MRVAKCRKRRGANLVSVIIRTYPYPSVPPRRVRGRALAYASAVPAHAHGELVAVERTARDRSDRSDKPLSRLPQTPSNTAALTPLQSPQTASNRVAANVQ